MIYTAGIFLFNKDNQLLLVHPTHSPDHHWSIPKGIPESNETIMEAAYREFYEETNVNLHELEIVYKFIGNNVLYPNKKKTLCPIFMKIIKGLDNIELKCNSLVDGRDFYENDKIQWFNLNLALDIMHKTQRIAFDESKPFNNLFVS